MSQQQQRKRRRPLRLDEAVLLATTSNNNNSNNSILLKNISRAVRKTRFDLTSWSKLLSTSFIAKEFDIFASLLYKKDWKEQLALPLLQLVVFRILPEKFKIYDLTREDEADQDDFYVEEGCEDNSTEAEEKAAANKVRESTREELADFLQVSKLELLPPQEEEEEEEEEEQEENENEEKEESKKEIRVELKRLVERVGALVPFDNSNLLEPFLVFDLFSSVQFSSRNAKELLSDRWVTTLSSGPGQLEHLDLRGSTVKYAELLNDQQDLLIKKSPKLKFIELNRADLPSTSVFNLPLLVHFAANRCALSDQALKSIADNSPLLEFLCVAWNESLSDESLVQIAQKCKKLTHVDLMGVNSLTDASICAFAKNCDRLESLNLNSGVSAYIASPKIGDASLAALSQKSRSNATLKSLDLGHNDNFSDDGISNLVSCTQLEWLNVSDCCEITAKGLKTVHLACKKLKIQYDQEHLGALEV